MSNETEPLLLVGGTGHLGSLILDALTNKGYPVRLLLRAGRTAPEGVEVVEGDLGDPRAVDAAVDGVAAVVCAVNGGPEVVVDGQLRLLAAAKAHGVGRFIPSDYSLDYFALDYGDNVFLDLRKRVAEAIEDSGVDHTFVLIGGFMENMLRRGAIDIEGGRMNFWGTGNEPVDVTAMADVARLVAEVVLDRRARNRRIQFAGDVVTSRSISMDYHRLTGRTLRLNHLGSVDELKEWIEKAKDKARSEMDYVFGQYAWAQLSGKGKLQRLMNDWYPQLRPTKMRAMLAQAIASRSEAAHP
jgi:uncharacterized protein YbjT (DUF2867 family)